MFGLRRLDTIDAALDIMYLTYNPEDKSATGHIIEHENNFALFYIYKSILYISFKGADSWSDKFCLFKIWFYNLFRGNINKIYTKNLDEFFDKIISRVGKMQYKFVLVGHSYGGALATLFAARYHNKINIGRVVLFGNPKIFNFIQQRNYNKETKFDTDTYIATYDIISYLPLVFNHLGNIFKSKSFWSTLCQPRQWRKSHSLFNYIDEFRNEK